MNILDKAKFLIINMKEIVSGLHRLGVKDYIIIANKNVLAYSPNYTDIYIVTDDYIKPEDEELFLDEINNLDSRIIFKIINHNDSVGCMFGQVTLWTTEDSVSKILNKYNIKACIDNTKPSMNKLEPLDYFK